MRLIHDSTADVDTIDSAARVAIVVYSSGGRMRTGDPLNPIHYSGCFPGFS